MKNHTALINEFVTLVKGNPTVTLAQYNNWLAKKEWYESTIIRYFVYKLAQGLSKHYEVEITEYSESNVLQKVRNWLVDTPAKKLERIIFNK